MGVRIAPRLLLGVLLGALLGPATALATAVVTITGHGNGHGIGLSQWGAEGLARTGSTSQEILAHYYPGTTLEVQAGLHIRVQLVDRARARLVADSIATATFDDGDPVPVSGVLSAVPRAVGGVELHDATGALIAGGTIVRLRAVARCSMRETTSCPM